MKNAILYFITIVFMTSASAQLTESRGIAESKGETDKVSQLVSVENFFAALAKEKGIKKAFLSVSDANTIIFRPEPVQVEKFFKNKQENSGSLSWEPVYARISKSSDWGFTTGPYTYKESDTSAKIFYGDYLSIWKKNQKDVWKLAIDLGIPHQKPAIVPKMVFTNPRNEKFQPQYSDLRLKQREEIVLSSDELFATILNTDNTTAHKTFLANDCRLLFPGYEPVVGKARILDFWEQQNIRVSSKPVKADRAYSGDLAFTYGDASIEQKGQNKLYHYVRIWELQPRYEWNIILEVYIEAAEL